MSIETIDLDQFTPAELHALVARIEAKKLEAERAHRDKTRREVLELIRSAGYQSIDDLFSSGGKATARQTIAAKFRNPSNPSQTWAGRGKRPGWFKEALAAGATEEQLRA